MENLTFTSFKPSDLTWEVAVRLFVLRNRSQNLAIGTQVLYGKHLAAFRRWNDRNGASSPATVAPALLRAFLSDYKATKASDATVDCAFRVLRTFWRFLHRDGLVLVDPMDRVERPRSEERLIRPFTDSQLRQLLGVFNLSDPLELRDYAVVVLLADTGLRLSEALSVKLGQIDWAQDSVVVMGKMRKERRVSFGATARKVLMNWIRRRGEIGGCEWVFVTRLGGKVEGTPFGHRLKEYTRRAGIAEDRLSAHALRHYFAVTFLKNGGSLPVLKRLLGHESLEMTQRYLNFSESDLMAQQQRQASPLDKLGVIPGSKKVVIR